MLGCCTLGEQKRPVARGAVRRNRISPDDSHGLGGPELEVAHAIE